jgi:nucleotide-binding universal stress UspA family protein
LENAEMRIVITSDGSELSQRGLAAAASLAREWAAEVSLLTVLDPSSVHDTVSRSEVAPEAGGADERARLRGAPMTPPMRVLEDRGAALESAREVAEDALRAEAAAHFAGLSCDIKVEWSEHPADAIVQFARESGARIVVMSSHGRSGLSQALMGSTTAAVVRHSPVPVLVVGAAVELDE